MLFGSIQILPRMPALHATLAFWPQVHVRIVNIHLAAGAAVEAIAVDFGEPAPF
ncbi:hypothetical protein D3C72_2299020 [compost metagenome]